MYLFAFMFLLLSLLGIFTQISAIQTAKFFAQQKTIGQVMINWHAAATTYARTLSPASYPYTLTTSTCSTTLPVTYIPKGDAGAYCFNSFIYRPTGSSARYIATFIPSTGATTMITSPALGISPNDLIQQLKNSKLVKQSYGLVAGTGTCTLITVSGLTQPIDCSAASGVTSGAIAIVSAIY